MNDKVRVSHTIILYWESKIKSVFLNTKLFSRDPVVFRSPDHLQQETNPFLLLVVVLQLFLVRKDTLSLSYVTYYLVLEVITACVSITGISTVFPVFHFLDLLYNLKLLWKFIFHTAWSSLCCGGWCCCCCCSGCNW